MTRGSPVAGRYKHLEMFRLPMVTMGNDDLGYSNKPDISVFATYLAGRKAEAAWQVKKSGTSEYIGLVAHEGTEQMLVRGDDVQHS